MFFWKSSSSPHDKKKKDTHNKLSLLFIIMDIKHRPTNDISASSSTKALKIGIVYARWNSKITDALLNGCVEELKRLGVTDISTLSVPGSFELVYAAKSIISEMDCVVCIGCLIKGHTMHFEYISESVSRGLSSLQLSSNVPIVYGVLNVCSEPQALSRAGLNKDAKDNHNHGTDWGSCAVEMALLRRYGAGTRIKKV